MKQVFVLVDEYVRRRALTAVLEAQLGYAVTVGPKSRSLEQNAAQWPILEAFANQIVWSVNGAPRRMNSEEWKEVLSAGFLQEEPQLAAGLNGGVVMLGHRTREFDKQTFSDWLDFLGAAAAERGVDLEI